MRAEHDLSKSPAPLESPSPTTPEAPVPSEFHAPWQTSRLILALIVCLGIIFAAVAYEKFG
ncbi:hypothetical protein JRI60_41740 [Archangium violaceum]|uniref:hypothetical protein n=1 Tax=Archangium violaceum TaxID=83451 RepID=UPI0019519ECD|nr:hypothetical protein [Archangium violaceum]QRN95521.1 hypothetical protein JRI60_41740 [Archangium violaceum]